MPSPQLIDAASPGQPPPPPPPPPPPLGSSALSHNRAPVLPQQQTPRPKAQMKHLPWNKISSTQVAGTTNIWSELGQTFNGYQMNFNQIEELFAVSQRSQRAKEDAAMRGDQIDGLYDDQTVNKRRTEVHLIDNKRSMNVSIFLRQFAGQSPADIVQSICCGTSESQLGADRLRFLQKILPEPDEVDLLCQYSGDRECLGLAERFYLELIAIPNYELLVEALLIKEEFQETLDRIKTALDAIVISAQEIKQNKAFRELIYMVLITGNFLNSGHYGGDAAGFHLNSLLTLTEIRANKPGMNLLHYVAQEAAEKNPKLIEAIRELQKNDLQDASVYPLESVATDIRILHQGVTSVLEHVSQSDSEFCQQMVPFFESADEDLRLLSVDMKEIETLRIELARYFCEDTSTFKIDHCIATFNAFCQKFLRAVEENNERAIQHQKAEERRRHREQKTRDSVSTGEIDQSLNESRSLDTSTQSFSQNLTTAANRTSGTSTDAGSPESRDVQQDLEQCLLRAVDGRRSSRRSRSRNRLSTEMDFSRERSRSPTSLVNAATGDVMLTPTPSNQADGADRRPVSREISRLLADSSGEANGLLRGTPSRSSCPSRVPSVTRKQTPAQSASATSSVTVTDTSASGGFKVSGTDVQLNQIASSPATVVSKPTSQSSGNSGETSITERQAKLGLRKKDSLGLERSGGGGLTLMSTDLSNSSIDLLNPCVRLLNGYATPETVNTSSTDNQKMPSVSSSNSDGCEAVQLRRPRGDFTASDTSNRLRQTAQTNSSEPSKDKSEVNRSPLSMTNGVGIPHIDLQAMQPDATYSDEVENAAGDCSMPAGSPSLSTYSDSMQRKASQGLKERFKRLSELYSADGEMVSGFSQSPSPSTGHHQQAVSDSTNGSAKRSESTFSAVSDEGFESDSCFSGSQRNSVISQIDGDASSTSSSTSSSSNSSTTSTGVSSRSSGASASSQAGRHQALTSAKDVTRSRTGGTHPVTTGKSSLNSSVATSGRSNRGTRTTTVAAAGTARANVENLSRRLSNFISTSASAARVRNVTSTGTTPVGGGAVKRTVTRPSTSRTVPMSTMRSLSSPSPASIRSQPLTLASPSNSAAHPHVSGKTTSTVSGTGKLSSASTINTSSMNSGTVVASEQLPERPRKPRASIVGGGTAFVRGSPARSSGGSAAKMAMTPFTRSSATRSTMPASIAALNGTSARNSSNSRTTDEMDGNKNRTASTMSKAGKCQSITGDALFSTDSSGPSEHRQRPDETDGALSLSVVDIAIEPSNASQISSNRKSTTMTATGSSSGSDSTAARLSRRDINGTGASNSISTSSVRTRSSGGCDRIGSPRIADKSPNRIKSMSTALSVMPSHQSETGRSSGTSQISHQRQHSGPSAIGQPQKPVPLGRRTWIDSNRREHFV